LRISLEDHLEDIDVLPTLFIGIILLRDRVNRNERHVQQMFNIFIVLFELEPQGKETEFLTVMSKPTEQFCDIIEVVKAFGQKKLNQNLLLRFAVHIAVDVTHQFGISSRIDSHGVAVILLKPL